MMWQVLLPLLGLELKRYWLNPLRIVLSLAQPLMYLFILGAGLAGGTYALDSSYQAYIYPGIVAMALMFAAASAAVGVVHDRQVGVFKALLVSPLPRSTLALARILSGAVLALVQSVLLLPFAPLLGLAFSPLSLLCFLLAMSLCALVFSALGLVMALPFRSVMVFPVVSNTLTLPMFLLSGALYPLELAPRWLQLLARQPCRLRSRPAARRAERPLPVRLATAVGVLLLIGLLAIGWVVHSLHGRGGRV
jgi:ABC-2 type transport system permease protein